MTQQQNGAQPAPKTARETLAELLRPGVDLCVPCDKRTEWSTVRGGRALKCNECGTRYPCESTHCGHQECDQVRELQKAVAP